MMAIRMICDICGASKPLLPAFDGIESTYKPEGWRRAIYSALNAEKMAELHFCSAKCADQRSWLKWIGDRE